MGFKVEDVSSGKVNIRVVKGDTFTQKVKIYTEDLLLYTPSEEDIITFAIWNKFTDAEPLYEKVLDYQNPMIVINSEESNAFKYGNYVYSVKIEFADGTVDTFLSGNFSIVVAGGDQ